VRASIRVILPAALGAVAAIAAACTPGSAPTPITTLVGSSTASVVKTSGIIDVNNNCTPAVPPAPNVAAAWNAQPPINKRFPIAGFEIWRNTTDGCTSTRLDAYRGIVTFNLAPLSNLKGLVTHADLIVTPRALPAGIGAHPACIAFTGGAGTLDRFGPATVGNVPPMNAAGTLVQLAPPDPFPAGTNTVFTFPRPWASGTIAGASNPTSTLASGGNMAVFTVDVTNSVNAALNSNTPGLSWMVTSAFEGPLPAPSPTSVDCKTPYDLRLSLTHF
jgi:hypothetical protein